MTSSAPSQDEVGGARTSSALHWTLLGAIARTVTQFIIGLILARVLGPRPFGIVAIAWLVIGLANLVADLGLSAAIVQRPTLTKKDIDFVTFAQVAVGISLTAAGFIFAVPLARMLGNTGAAAVLRVLSPIFFLQSLGQTSTALLRRDLRFKPIYALYVGSYLIGYAAVGIPLALLGAGEWSLVGAQLVQAAATAVGSNIAARYFPRVALRPETSGLVSFGSKVAIANVTSWLLSNLDSAVVARTFGTVALGIYSRTSSLTLMVPNALVPNLQGLAFSAAAQSARDGAKAGRLFNELTTLVALVIGFITVLLYADAHAVIAVLYGPKWREAATILQPLAIASLAFSLLALVGPILTAENRVGTEIAAQLVSMGFAAVIFVYTARLGYLKFAWGVAAVYWLRYAVLRVGMKRALQVNLLTITTSLRLPVIAGSIALAACLIVKSNCDAMTPILRLMIEVILSTIIYGVFIYVFRRDLYKIDAVGVVVRRVGQAVGRRKGRERRSNERQVGHW